MQLGQPALPPEGYVAFCERQPWDCGDAQSLILAGAAKAEAERAALFAMGRPKAAAGLEVTAALGGGSPHAGSAAGPLSPVDNLPAAADLSHPRVDVAQGAPPTTLADANQERADAAPGDRPETTEPPRMSPQLWARLNRVNGEVNHAIVQATDLATYGEVDRWATPLEGGVRTGDCEDYVLEKERALLAAGVARAALNIALVTTPWGEGHAVLLVTTSEGEFVLDSLTDWITPWQKTGYRWRQRQVAGQAFSWVMIQDPSRQRGAPDRGGPDHGAAGDVTVAALR